jgi:hypothetical protein
MAGPTDDALVEIGFPLRPEGRRGFLGAAALPLVHGRVWQAARAGRLEGDMLAAYLSALAAEFPSLYRSRSWPQVVVQDSNRYLKLRRLIRAHLTELF